MLAFGIDSLLHTTPSWKGLRIGMVTNEAATTRLLEPSRQALLKAGFNIQVLFSPEHGLDVRGADGHAIKDGYDLLTGLPVISLYGERLAPTEAQLADIDLLLFDVPDIGSRFYTYLWTLTYLIETAAATNKKLVLLDRPNPVSGNMQLCEGPMLTEANNSFIGRWEMPVRHSCTLGELALYFNDTRKIHADIEVIRCENWQRDSFQPDWGIPFVPTSPAIQSFQSMLLYPGLCLLEATNISEARGTAYSFEAAGSPWLHAEVVADMLNNMSGGEITTATIQFTPVHSKFEKQLCNAVHMKVDDRSCFNAVMNGMILIKLIKSLHPSQFSWATYPTSVNPSGKGHLDKLLGISNSEALFDLPVPAFIATITKYCRCKEWEEEVGENLLYE
ncbi:DUF1343 domain-containing protein [Sediminibacterium sp.]|uniref:exo-beta-N-acetylmuramidase NamZ family protein n=1 Tax=Sediminibacterium sp. TaxID=1917865 RepID=UPI0025F55586|nr:DUF1343 domain-containing protein [Sediminibacterium sp.]MBW0176322.1 DUF1343 domain-containing protein [Sediminibacterium sp.]